MIRRLLEKGIETLQEIEEALPTREEVEEDFARIARGAEDLRSAKENLGRVFGNAFDEIKGIVGAVTNHEGEDDDE